jgi:hypothetical protein
VKLANARATTNADCHLPCPAARFYAPKKEFFDNVWKLPDVEEVK